VFPFDPDNESKAESGGDKLMLYGFVVLFGGLMLAEILNGFAIRKLGFAFLLIAYIGLTVLHEYGHAWMARAFGWRVYEIVIGFGPTVKTWRSGTARVELKAYPLGGHMVPVPPDDQPRRFAQFWIYFAGPGIELALVGVLIAIIGWDRLLTYSDSVGILAAQATCVAALWGAITNLFPMSTADGAVTDGLGMLRSPWMQQNDFARQQASPYLVEGYRRLQAKNGLGANEVFESGLARYPDIPALHIGRFDALVMLGQRSEAMMYLQTASTSPERSEDCRAALAEHIKLIRRLAEIGEGP
jgi:hypothetical protein